MAVAFALLLSAIAALADVIGGALPVIRQLSEKQIVLATALGSGFLLGATCLDRLPESMQELPATAPLYIILAYLAMLLLERYGGHVHTHGHAHMHEHENHGDRLSATDSRTAVQMMSQRAGWATFVGMLIHTFMDGVVIAGAFSMNAATGVLMFLAITMHKIPEGFSMATISLAAGESAKRAFASALCLAVSTLTGAVITLWAGAIDAPVVKVIMALATGTFLFITTTSLIPAVKDSRVPRAASAVVLGVVLFAISLYVVKHVGLS